MPTRSVARNFREAEKGSIAVLERVKSVRFCPHHPLLLVAFLFFPFRFFCCFFGVLSLTVVPLADLFTVLFRAAVVLSHFPSLSFRLSPRCSQASLVPSPLPPSLPSFNTSVAPLHFPEPLALPAILHDYSRRTSKLTHPLLAERDLRPSPPLSLSFLPLGSLDAAPVHPHTLHRSPREARMEPERGGEV
jgi:hypothetical protein